ncbi:MAG: terpene cyclase/mutase family protein [Planctomycetes bacterium]|nr:terpene cyclase/mutase family protein [Planctomycetota bacterium]
MKIRRRSFLAGAAAGAVSLGFGNASRVAAQGRTELDVAAGQMITPVADRAIQRGLEWLAGRHNDDGSFASGSYGRNVGVCALAGLAFMSEGSTPGRGRYGANVSRIVDYLLEHTQETGYVHASGAASHGPMYGHGFATMFLAEVYGMTPRSDIREKLAKAVQLIVNTQNAEGGWRYQPQRMDADLSVTVCEIMALRAARNAGINVPVGVVERTIDYVKRCQNPDGGFMYMTTGGASAFPRSAAGIVALYSAGVYEGREIDQGLEYLMQHLPRGDNFGRESHYFYGHYYGVQAMWHAGGDYWRQWYPAIRDALLARQRDDGSWLDQISPEYGTAMASIILQMPNNYLPIFQP